MLRSVYFENLKGLRETSLDLAPLTVLVGPNGAGKTTLLEGIWLAGQVARVIQQAKDHPMVVFKERWGVEKLLRAGATRMSARLTVGQDELELTFKNGVPEVRWLTPGGLVLDWTDAKSGLHQKEELLHLASAFKMRLDQERIAQPSRASTGLPVLQEDGANLATFLQRLNDRRDGSLEAIERTIRPIVPRFQGVSFESTSVRLAEFERVIGSDGVRREIPVEREYPGVQLQLKFTEGNDPQKEATVPAVHASEGTLLVLALLTVAHAPHASRLLLIDDLDRALHPAAQYRVIEALRAAIQATPDLQIVATSHSPDLVDACRPEEVRVMGFDADGYPAIASLMDHPEAEKWLSQLRPGELWNSAGEGWVGAAARRKAAEREGHGEHG